MTKNRILNEKRVIFNFLSNKQHIFVIILRKSYHKFFILNFGQILDKERPLPKKMEIFFKSILYNMGTNR